MSLDSKLSTISHLRELKLLADTHADLKRIMTLPRGILDDDIGYIMANADGYESLSKFMDPPAEGFDEWFVTRYSLKRRYLILIDLFDSLRTVHINGLVFADLSPSNIMVRKDEKHNGIAFIDTDNLVTRPDTIIDVLGTPGYIAPEILRKDLPSEIGGSTVPEGLLSKHARPTVDSDIFSAAIIAFQVLMLQHPFIGDVVDDGTPEDETNALNIGTDYIGMEGTDNVSTHGLMVKFLELTTPRIRDLFLRTFVAGKDRAGLRPTADEFLEAFQDALGRIITCPSCGFSRLFSPDGLIQCINCDRVLDRFVILQIYNIFEDMDSADAINFMNDDRLSDVSIENLVGEDGSFPETKTLISEVVLDPGVERKLYLHNFESTTQRSKLYATVTLSETSDFVRFEGVEKCYPEAVCTKDGRSRTKKLASGQEFDLARYNKIIFQRKPFGKGSVVLACQMELYQ